jgi:hypothetical protein
VIVDINSSDFNSASPPAAFLTAEFFKKVNSTLNPVGDSVLIVNVIDRFSTLKTFPWGFYYSIKCEDDHNEVDLSIYIIGLLLPIVWISVGGLTSNQ